MVEHLTVFRHVGFFFACPAPLRGEGLAAVHESGRGLASLWKPAASFQPTAALPQRESYGTASSHRPDRVAARRLADLGPLAELGIRAERHFRTRFGGRRGSDPDGSDSIPELLSAAEKRSGPFPCQSSKGQSSNGPKFKGS